MTPHAVRLLAKNLFPALCVGFAACAASQSVQSAVSDARTSSHDGNVHSDIAFLCFDENSSLIISKNLVAAPAGYERRSVDLETLVVYEEGDPGGFGRRTGTRTQRSTCGDLIVSIQGAFYNEDPGGELGAADDYAVVAIYLDEKLLIGPVAIGACSVGNPRYDIYAECPAQWATKLSVYRSPDGGHWIEFQHAYDELMRSAP